jgi:pSer/pThr/pTyr-binding forkhead associated (FHA) protein
MATLRVTSGPGEGRSFDCDREVVVGREGVDVIVDDPELSRRHAAIRPVSGGLEIEDLGSRNGTFVDGERLAAPRTVSETVALRMGTTTFALELSAGDVPIMDPQRTVVRPRPDAPPGSEGPAAAPERPIVDVGDRTVMRERPIVDVPSPTVVRDVVPIASAPASDPPPAAPAPAQPPAGGPPIAHAPAGGPGPGMPPGGPGPAGGPPGPLPRPVLMMMKSPLGRRLLPLMAKLPPRARKPVLALIPLLVLLIVAAIVVVLVTVVF